MKDCILALETSCDDTSVALVDQLGRVIQMQSANQDFVHKLFGGIVPEEASRLHVQTLLPLVEEVLRDSGRTMQSVRGIAVTSRPGLIGSLMVGVVTAKALALSQGLPFIGVNHIEGHLLAPLLRDEQYAPPDGFKFPYLALVISGGHTHLFMVHDVGNYHLLGLTRDDAAGEAFDKFAKMLGLGFPGGARVDELAKAGNAKAFNFPRAMLNENNLDFSFSGLKTAAQNQLVRMDEVARRDSAADLCASYQQAIVDVLLAKLERAVDQHRAQRVALTGGVSANSALREQAQLLAKRRQFSLALPPLRYCTDNAAMIGLVGLKRFERGEFSTQDLSPSAQAFSTDYRLGSVT